MGDRQGPHEVLPVRPPSLLSTTRPSRTLTLKHPSTSRTTYKSLSKVDPDLAKKTFLAHAGFYRTSASRPPGSPHRTPESDPPISFLLSFRSDPIARRMIAKDLGVDL